MLLLWSAALGTGRKERHHTPCLPHQHLFRPLPGLGSVTEQGQEEGGVLGVALQHLLFYNSTAGLTASVGITRLSQGLPVATGTERAN